MSRVFIIAEAGVNHNGSLEIAEQLVDVAAAAGADAIKFQTFKAETLVSKTAQKAEYQKRTTDGQETQFEMIKKLELDVSAHKHLIAYCAEKGIEFFSTPFDNDSIDLLDQLGVRVIKVASGEITNLPYLRKVGCLNKQVILSTGMSSLLDIEMALGVLIEAGTVKENVTVLHANTEYPTPMEDVNLRAMKTIADAFNVEVGYSDHTIGIEVDIAAVAMGAAVIEKHFTLDRTMSGPDHRASLEPAELRQMVRAIRNIEKALGSGEKVPSRSETKNIEIVRKSIVASRSILQGEILTEDNLSTKRPGRGLSPMLWDQIIGTTATRSYKVDDPI